MDGESNRLALETSDRERVAARCRICGAAGDATQHSVREMNFGAREPFVYLECDACGSLQIKQAPADLGRHYPQDYLGDDRRPDIPRTLKAAIKAFVGRRRTAYYLGARTLVGWAASQLGHDDLEPHLRALGRTNPRRDASILDVGCGPGRLLNRLHSQGFKNLVGQDAFQQWTFDGFDYRKRPLAELFGEFDVVTLNHSLEHMEDLVSSLSDIRRITAPDGVVVIRIPLAGCEAWRRYGVDWYQIDAPRHLNIPSLRGMETLARRARFRIDRVEFDSDETQFLVSEQYRRDVPLRDERSCYRRRRQTLFSSAEVRSARRDARQANRDRLGDQACFYLKHDLPR